MERERQREAERVRERERRRVPRRNVPCKARPEALLLGGLATHSPLSQPETDTRRRRRPTRRVSLGPYTWTPLVRTPCRSHRRLWIQICPGATLLERLKNFVYSKDDKTNTRRDLPIPCPLDDDDVNHPSVRYTPAEHERRAERARTVHAFGATPVKTSTKHRTQEHRTTTCA
jgi:hypothetical protein